MSNLTDNKTMQIQKITSALEGSGWSIQESEDNTIIFTENTITKGQMKITSDVFDPIASIKNVLAVFTFPSAKKELSITIEQAVALLNSIIALQKNLRIALTEPGVKRFWMRVGVSFDLTLEEFAAVEAGGDEGEQIIRKKFRENLYRLDGDSYSPNTEEENDETLWPHDEIDWYNF